MFYVSSHGQMDLLLPTEQRYEKVGYPRTLSQKNHSRPNPQLRLTENSPKENHELPQSLDHIFDALIGQFTANLSTASLINAYVDWINHLCLSPSKQYELILKAFRKSFRCFLYALAATQQNHASYM